MRVIKKKGFAWMREHPFITAECNVQDNVDEAIAHWLISQKPSFLLPLRYETCNGRHYFFYDLTGAGNPIVQDSQCLRIRAFLRFSAQYRGNASRRPLKTIFTYSSLIRELCSVMHECDMHKLPLRYVSWDQRHIYCSGEGVKFIYIPAAGMFTNKRTIYICPWELLQGLGEDGSKTICCNSAADVRLYKAIRDYAPCSSTGISAAATGRNNNIRVSHSQSGIRIYDPQLLEKEEHEYFQFLGSLI